MKKRSILFSILLVLTLVIGACGSGNDPFKGTWRGKLDVTKQFEDGIKERYPDLEEYVDFEDLVFELDVTFEDGVMWMHVVKASEERFDKNFADGMLAIEKGSLVEILEAKEILIEEEIAELGMTEEEYVAMMLNSEEVTSIMNPMKENMKSITDAALAGFEAVNGTYTFNEEHLHIRYSDDKYEEIAYDFEGDNLVLTFDGEIQGQKYSLRIVCEK
jgi:hypothetical protein